MRQGPPRRPLATCFRAVGNELQAAVQCECRAVGGAASPWLDAGRVHWRLKGECRAGTRNETHGWDPLPDGVHVSREGGCAAQGGPCAAARAVCGQARGCREVKTRAACMPVRPSGTASPPGHERGGTRCVCVCVFVRHTARRRLWGVGAACEEAAGKKGEPARDATWAAVDHRMRSAVCVRPPGWRGERRRALEPKIDASSQPQVCGRGGITSGRNIKVFQSQARRGEAGRGAGGRASRLGPEPLVRARLPRGAPGQKKKATARRAPIRGSGGGQRHFSTFFFLR